MAYTVLARKYRSRTFDDVIGQEPIATTLKHAVESGRVAHGYLFTGTRGVGKTSMARILAKALNCLASDAPTTTPCCKCDACVAIAEGQDIDVVEIDAASNTGVDNIRELRSQTAYRPARCRYKVYIIDEVHMLSTGAFNALLKTLEEPPEHVKFILATTEIQKVPATIRSRCQQFYFRNIPPEAIARRLAEICEAEGAEAEPAVVQRVARLAAGSMRDALSILDQLLSVAEGKLTLELLEQILPPALNEQVFTLIERAAEGDVPGVLKTADAILAGGRALDVFCTDLVEALHALLLLKACDGDAALVDLSTEQVEQLRPLAQRFELSQFVQLIGMFEELRRNVRFSAAGRALADAALVRMAKLHDWAPIEKLLRQHRPAASQTAAARAAAPPASTQPASARAATRGSGEKKKPAPQPVEAVTGAEGRTTAAADAGRLPPQRADGGRSPRTADGSQRPRSVDGGQPPPAVDAAQPATGPPGGEYVLLTGEAPETELVERRPVGEDQRRRILDDPLVRQALDDFEGVIVNLEQIIPRQQSERKAETESEDEPVE